MTDKAPLKVVDKTKPAPGHADILGDTADAPRPLIVSTQVNSVVEACEVAEDLGLWFACYTGGCISPALLKKGVRDGKKLWQLLNGDPAQLQAQGQLAQATGDLFNLQMIDPNHAIAILEKRSQDARACADGIRQGLLSSSEGNTGA